MFFRGRCLFQPKLAVWICVDEALLHSHLFVSGIFRKPFVMMFVGFPFHLWGDVLLHPLYGDGLLVRDWYGIRVFLHKKKVPKTNWTPLFISNVYWYRMYLTGRPLRYFAVSYAMTLVRTLNYLPSTTVVLPIEVLLVFIYGNATSSTASVDKTEVPVFIISDGNTNMGNVSLR